MEEGSNFFWGAAISAAQTESAIFEDGKGLSIWDEFCNRKSGLIRKKSVIKNGDHLKDSCDFYTHYRQDIDLLHDIGFKHFRFSISWPRVMPDGINPNPLGIKFYQEVVDYCLQKGIQPWITLYHWDLPLSLEQKGGWTNRQIIFWFTQYTLFCVKNLPQVKNWIILNEPSVFLGAGHLFGIHAPGRKGYSNFFAATHHAMLALNQSFRAIKEYNPQLNLGSSFSMTHIEANSESTRDRISATRADALINRFFIEPVLGKGYPLEEVKLMRNIKKYFLKGDEDLLQTQLDFIGVQTYTREVFKHNPFNPYLKIKHVPASERSIDLTAMNWEIHPESIYHTVMKIHNYKLNIPILVTENGVAFKEEPIYNRIHDFGRIHYYQTHINEVMRAKDEGANVKGYFAWSLLDNFEWADGFEPRFGLIHVDFKSKKRTLKESAKWFRSFLGAADKI